MNPIDIHFKIVKMIASMDYHRQVKTINRYIDLAFEQFAMPTDRHFYEQALAVRNWELLNHSDETNKYL
jgi:hypothetical protein